MINKKTFNEQSTNVSSHFLRAYCLWGHKPFSHAQSPHFDEHSGGGPCASYRHRYVLWGFSRFTCGVLSRSSLILKTRGTNLCSPSIRVSHLSTQFFKKCISLHIDFFMIIYKFSSLNLKF